MKFKVYIVKKAKKNILKAPPFVQAKFVNLVKDLEDFGPVQPKWQHYSKLGKAKYHCHLADKWVACWICEEKSVIVEVSYAGSRESAPY